MNTRLLYNFVSIAFVLAFLLNATAATSKIEIPKELNEDITSNLVNNKLYEPTWPSLDNRTLPAWYDQSKVGIFIHWGVFSVPSFGGEWFWSNWKIAQSNSTVEFMEKNYPPNFTYQEFGPQFTAEFFDPERWADLFKRSGARHVVLTSKHHEGYTLWPSKYSFSWNSMDVGPRRDLVGELATAIRANTTLKFGLYHSLYEWFNPLYLSDKENLFATDEFVRFKTLPELYEIVNTYKPEVVWSDGEWEAGDDYWQSKEFLAWLYNDSPVKDTVVTNDRWGGATLCKHGGFFTCLDRYNPGTLQPHKWENCFTLDRSWGYRRNSHIEDYMTPETLMKTIIETVSCGGNVLVNVGPTKEGTITPIQEERLLQMGEWLGINGEAIYETTHWTVQNDTLTPGIWYTTRPAENKVYAMLLEWPTGQVQLGSVEPSSVVSMELLGGPNRSLVWRAADPGVIVEMPCLSENKSKWAWTIKINVK